VSTSVGLLFASKRGASVFTSSRISSLRGPDAERGDRIGHLRRLGRKPIFDSFSSTADFTSADGSRL